MQQINIRNLGVGALEIRAGDKRLLVDAFNTLNQPEKVLPGDILLFTHDDGDHFNAQSLPELKQQNVTVIGPPTIVKPILELDKAELKQLQVLYSKDNQNPDCISLEGVCIKAFHTEHFNQWGAINNSYLIEVNDRKLYITGDSLLTKELSNVIGKTDAVICNLVDEGFLKGYEDRRFAVHHNLSYLLKISTLCNPVKMIGVHLLNFEWTVDAEDMRRLVEAYGFYHIIIPTSTTQLIDL